MFAEARVDCFYTTMRKRCASLVRRVRASPNLILSGVATRLDCEYGNRCCRLSTSVVAFKPPRDQRFYRFLAMTMTICHLGDQRWWGMGPVASCPLLVQINRTLTVTMAPCVLLSQIIYLYINFNELTLNLMGMIFCIVPVTFLVNVLLVAARLKDFEKVMKIFMDKIHIYNFKDESDFACKKVIKVERNIRWTAYALFTLLMSDWVGWILTAFFHNLANAEAIRDKTTRLQTVIYLYVPFDYEYNYTNWFFIHLLNVYLVWLGVVSIVTSQTIMYAFIYNLLGHIDILRHKIRSNFSKAYTDAEMNMKLIDIVKYHNFVLRTFKDVENAFGLSISSHYLYNLIGDSLLLFQIMYGDPENRMVYGLMVIVYIGGLILMSFVLENIRRQTIDLLDLVYNLPWEKMSIRNQKILMLILKRMQLPLVFKTSGGMRGGVKPMISILKSTFSYYVMLKSSMKT